MRTITVQELSAKAFAKYGTYQDLFNTEEMQNKSPLPFPGFFPDMISLDFDMSRTLPTASLCHVKKSDRMIISFLEAHQYTCEGLLPIDEDVIIYVGTLGMSFGNAEKFSVETVEAFRVPKGTFVRLAPMTLHGGQFPVSAPEAHILCLLPARTFKNDMLAKMIANDEDKAEIVMA